jgi:hypothetical protein
MTFDARIFEAQLALGEIAPEELPALAWDAVEAGYDGPALRRLGALEKPSGWETDRWMSAVLKEMNLRVLDTTTASLRLAQHIALEILVCKTDPLLHIDRFYTYWLRSDYATELTTIGNLDDCFSWMDEGEVRALALSELNILANCEIG